MISVELHVIFCRELINQSIKAIHNKNLISKYDFGPVKLPGLSRNGPQDPKDWRQESFHGNVTMGVISAAKFEEHYFNISRDILYSVFYHLVVNLMIETLISPKRKIMIRKGERHFILIRRSNKQ